MNMANNTSSPGVDPALSHVENVSVPLTSYSMRGNPRGGPGVADVEGGPPPGNRVPVTARAEDPAGAALDIVTGGDRARTIRDYETNAPRPYDPAQDRKGMRVMPSRAGANGQSPLWQSRARNTARGR
jgi:hypothetical protein